MSQDTETLSITPHYWPEGQVQAITSVSGVNDGAHIDPYLDDFKNSQDISSTHTPFHDFFITSDITYGTEGYLSTLICDDNASIAEVGLLQRLCSSGGSSWLESHLPKLTDQPLALAEVQALEPSVNEAAGFEGEARNSTHRAEDCEREQIFNMKTAILSHHLYPHLVAAYRDCQKVGAPEHVLHKVEEAYQALLQLRSSVQQEATVCAAPSVQLDLFMNEYIGILVAFRADLERPFEEARNFCQDFDNRLNHVADKIASTNAQPPEEVGAKPAESSYEEDTSGNSEGVHVVAVDPTADEAELKEQLKRKYRAYLSSLKQEFLKKNKKGKLPKEATSMLQDWWSNHLNWPYPSEGQKTALAQQTGLDPKQINNWFINQRKRHWDSTPGATGADRGVLKGRARPRSAEQ